MSENAAPPPSDLQAFTRAGDEAERMMLEKIAHVDALAQKGEASSADFQNVSYMLFTRRKFTLALTYMERAAALEPANGTLLWNIVNIYMVSGQFGAALEVSQRAMALSPEYPAAFDCLARIHGHLGDMEQARRYGDKALLAKDKRSTAGPGPRYEIPKQSPPPFDASKRAANIITYSLWGDSDRYLGTLLQNTKLRHDFYPGWTMRVHYEAGIRPSLIRDLRAAGCQLVEEPKQSLLYQGLFWRFKVISDRSATRFQVRDADDLFSDKDAKAVGAWLKSDKYFHLMRDWFEQTDLVNAGLWGGVTGILPPVGQLLKQFKLSGPPSRMVDQQFLNDMVWPTIKQSILIHDSIYTAFSPDPFPASAANQATQNLGRYSN
jgi:tetratricopeptide (TPR) repeat protein